MKRLRWIFIATAAWLFAGCADMFGDGAFSEEPLTGSAWSETVSEEGVTVKFELFFMTSTEVKIRITAGIGADARSQLVTTNYTYNPPMITLTLDRETITGRVSRDEIIFGEDEDDLWDDYENDDDFLVFNKVNDAKWPE